MNDPDGPYGGLSKQEQIELIWEDIESAVRARDRLLAEVDDYESYITELKAELHDLKMGAL